jgi:hypothetical protein
MFLRILLTHNAMNNTIRFFRHFSTQEKKSSILKFLSLWSIVLLLGIGGVKGQTLIDSYTDENFTASPVWGGSTSNWSIVANSDAAAGATGSNTLRLNVSTGDGRQYLSTQVTTWGTSQEWGFWIGRRAQAFTAVNQMHIWLYANEANLTSATVDGYRIAIGDDSGNDDIRLEYIVNGAVSSTVIASAGAFTNGLTDVGLLLRVTRSNTGGWEVFTSAIPTSNGSGAIASGIPNSTNAATSQGTATNNSLVPASNGYAGVLAIHSTGANARAAVEFDQLYLTVSGGASAPTIITSLSNLTSFTQTSATPSAEQTYTVSGDNLTADVSIAPPTGYEISTATGGAFSATNPITLTQSGGNLVGEPVTIYVRQSASSLGAVSGNITHTSTGANNPNVAVSGTRTGTYYSKSTGNLDVLANWGLNTDGTGTAPANFTADGAIYEIRNRATATIGANWVVSGAASKVVVGDGTNATDFTIPSGFTLTGTIDVSNAAELTIENTTAPTFGTFAINSTLEYNNVAITLSTATTYRNLKLTGTGTKIFPGGTTTISGSLTLDGTTLNGAGSSTFSTILLAGNLTYVGTVTPPADGNSITLSTNGTASGTQTITGAGNTVRWFRITTTTANTVVLSTTGGTSNIYLGNGAGGGITLFDGSVLNMNGNDFQLFNGTSSGSAAFVMTTGTISTTSATDFTIERTFTGALGTLRFTTGSNTIGNLTLNHAGATNTLTIGNALNVSGVITVTAGTLASGPNLTLKSNASGTASIGNSAGTISGNITVERFIPSRRAYRFLSSPVTTSNGINNNWQLQTHITGTGTGFDATTLNNPSMFTLNESTQGWTAITNTQTSNLTQGVGYRLFIRGDRSVDLTNNAAAPTAVTLSATGSHTTGDKTYNTVSTPAISGTTNNYTFIGNPFPSSIDWNAISRNNVSTTYYTWKAQGGTNSRGTYVNYNATGSVSSDGNVNQYIGSGSGFIIQTTGAAPSIVIEEQDKVSNAQGSQILGKTSHPNMVRAILMEDDSVFADGFVIYQDNSASDDKDAFDSEKWLNPGISMYSLTNDAKKVSIQGFKNLVSEKVIYLGMEKTEKKTYKLLFSEMGNLNGEVFLNDKYTNKETSLKNNPVYTFIVNNDANSSAIDRFKIVFRNSVNKVSEVGSENNFFIYPNPASSEINISLTSANKGVYQYGVYNQLGQELTTGNFNFNTNTIQTLNIEALGSGVYFIKITNGNQSQTIKFIK